jgi:hypothetical protein
MLDIIFYIIELCIVFCMVFFIIYIIDEDTVIAETTTEKEIIKLKHLLPSTKKLYMIDYSNNIITFVDNKGEVIELPFEKMFIEITQDKDKANILKLECRVKKSPDGEIVKKECEKATIFQCDKEIDD